MSVLPDLAELDQAAATVYEAMPPTPQYCWPLLCEALGAEVWVKHENHTPIGAFKVRGGLLYFHDLSRHGRRPEGVISATRGNHGQSVAFAARRYGVPVTIVVPHGNSVEKNAAMRAQGAKLVVHGEDFQSAREHAAHLAAERGLLMVPSFHPLLVRGVGTYSMELLRAVHDLEVMYVPVGLGSGICGMMAARAALNRKFELVAVVSDAAPAYALSFAARRAIEYAVTTVIADGMACRTPEPEALELLLRHVDRVVRVTDAEIGRAMRLMFTCTHNVAEGAGAAGLAAAMQERRRIAGRRVGVVLSGGNVDREVYARSLAAG